MAICFGLKRFPALSARYITGSWLVYLSVRLVRLQHIPSWEYFVSGLTILPRARTNQMAMLIGFRMVQLLGEFLTVKESSSFGRRQMHRGEKKEDRSLDIPFSWQPAIDIFTLSLTLTETLSSRTCFGSGSREKKSFRAPFIVFPTRHRSVTIKTNQTTKKYRIFYNCSTTLFFSQSRVL